MERLDAIAGAVAEPLRVFLVDDGSTGPGLGTLGFAPRALHSIEVVELFGNLGHQRAIAIGLDACLRASAPTGVIVMDGDGEDRPEDVLLLLEAHRRTPDAIVVARRTKRSEGISFRILYRLYKAAFRALTGASIDFGNFCLLPVACARRVVHMPESWNHLAATLLRSRLPLLRVRTVRGVRFAGRSGMNIVALVTHGFSAISVFHEIVLTRMLFVLGAIGCGAVATGLTAAALRFFTDLAIPGWASNVVGFSLLLLFQTLSLLGVMVFVSLSNRSAILFVPARRAREHVRAVRRLFGKDGRERG